MILSFSFIALWHHMVLVILVNIGSGNGLVRDRLVNSADLLSVESLNFSSITLTSD